MPLIGTLRTWHDDRGFGFIAPRHGGAEIFVHISAFPRDGSRPVVGETLSYELGRGKDGQPQAARVVRTAIGAPPPAAGPRKPARTGSLLGTLLVLALVVGAASYGFKRYQAYDHRRQLEAQPATAPVEAGTGPHTPHAGASPVDRHCDGRRHCSQMTSCAEATWFINHCPGTTMDGNHDGVPCEQQWCSRGGTP